MGPCGPRPPPSTSVISMRHRRSAPQKSESVCPSASSVSKYCGRRCLLKQRTAEVRVSSTGSSSKSAHGCGKPWVVGRGGPPGSWKTTRQWSAPHQREGKPARPLGHAVRARKSSPGSSGTTEQQPSRLATSSHDQRRAMQTRRVARMKTTSRRPGAPAVPLLPAALPSANSGSGASRKTSSSSQPGPCSGKHQSCCRNTSEGSWQIAGASKATAWAAALASGTATVGACARRRSKYTAWRRACGR
mmetsp:Transcript_4621/g.14314  ORF Transcript_4621/g.14314 Transcript_4621/m.14314 type:complete len:246 (-) Transcript_4621:6-743(-)